MATYTDEEIRKIGSEIRELVNECSNVTLVSDRKAIESYMEKITGQVNEKFKAIGVNASLVITNIDVAKPAVDCQLVPHDKNAIRFLTRLEQLEGESPAPDTWAALSEEINSKE